MKSSPDTRRCPKCHGNLFLDKDKGGWYLECLQCGYRRETGSYKPQEAGQGLQSNYMMKGVYPQQFKQYTGLNASPQSSILDMNIQY